MDNVGRSRHAVGVQQFERQPGRMANDFQQMMISTCRATCRSARVAGYCPQTPAAHFASTSAEMDGPPCR
jgi:hypothetical protein